MEGAETGLAVAAAVAVAVADIMVERVMLNCTFVQYLGARGNPPGLARCRETASSQALQPNYQRRN
jgi:hypothetical protein